MAPKVRMIAGVVKGTMRLASATDQVSTKMPPSTAMGPKTTVHALSLSRDP